MKSEEIFENIIVFKEKFKSFFQQRKQVTALENHSLVRKFTDAETEVLSTIKFCMKGSFLQDEDADWMNRKLQRLQINYLDWAHKTKWLKEQIEEGKVVKKPTILQTFFEFDRQPQQSNVPIEMINTAIATQISARI